MPAPLVTSAAVGPLILWSLFCLVSAALLGGVAHLIGGALRPLTPEARLGRLARGAAWLAIRALIIGALVCGLVGLYAAL